MPTSTPELTANVHPSFKELDGLVANLRRPGASPLIEPTLSAVFYDPAESQVLLERMEDRFGEICTGLPQSEIQPGTSVLDALGGLATRVGLSHSRITEVRGLHEPPFVVAGRSDPNTGVTPLMVPALGVVKGSSRSPDSQYRWRPLEQDELRVGPYIECRGLQLTSMHTAVNGGKIILSRALETLSAEPAEL